VQQFINTTQSEKTAIENSKMNSDKVFYFFIENEFICRPNLDLTTVSSTIYSSQAITINLVNFTSKGIGEVYKIFKNVSPNGYDQNEMVNLYQNIKDHINANFIANDKNKIFIGCVRDDNGTHERCNQEILKFSCRTDPIHDIFNILKNIYLLKNDTYQRIIYDGNFFNYGDLRMLLPPLYDSIPIVEYYDLSNKSIDRKIQRIWIPDRDRALKYFMEPIRYLFSINYYEKVNNEVPDSNVEAKSVLKFILLLKDILMFNQEEIINSVTIEVYRELHNELKKYSFENQAIRCLESLKNTMKTNIDFFENYKVPFEPIWFSTLMIEAEKGKLRYEACNDAPTVAKCKNWFETAMKEGSNLIAFSEFGKCTLNIEPLAKKFWELPGRSDPKNPRFRTIPKFQEFSRPGAKKRKYSD